MILLIDNYDSFVFNLARYFERLGQPTTVARNDTIDAAAVRRLAPRAIVLSPGPCTPNEAGCSLEIVRELHHEIPILGVCLGHQAIGQAFAARIVRAPAPVHGRSSRVFHNSDGLFRGVPNPLSACRYHSLVIHPATMPRDLETTATLDDGTIMAVQHRQYPVVGVQFHPESVLTQNGYKLLANFLRLAGCDAPNEARLPDDEVAPNERAYAPPPVPVTF
jgi:anthranilate synthase/aminodeoxychorismate synthase-like glutamine amidotransferase